MSVDLDIVLYICGVITSTSAAVAIVIKLVKKKIANTIEENETVKNISSALVSQIRYQIDSRQLHHYRRRHQADGYDAGKRAHQAGTCENRQGSTLLA